MKQISFFFYILFLLSKNAFAIDMNANVIVDGSVRPAPVWKNAFDFEITSLNFQFGGFSYAPQARDVLSGEIEVKLENALSYPATLFYYPARDCHIGKKQIRDADISLFLSGQQVTSTFQVGSPNPIKIKLGFSAAGKYADSSGNVICDKSGYLRYTY